jgi:multiple sugar transport system substrate-binding protein
VQLFYGWLQDYLKAGLLQPLPASDFSAIEVEREFFPIVQQMKVDGKYYALPTAVRSLALFWNKTLFKEAGLDPNKPPATLDELVDYAKKLTKRSPNGDLIQEGLTIDMGGQDHHWLREVLIRQFGGEPYSADKEDGGVQQPRRHRRHAVVRRPRRQAEGGTDRLSHRRRHRIPLGQGRDDHRRLVSPGRAR